MKKISFTIENAEMIQENPDSKFALLALDYFASGDNLHDMYVSEETLMRTADTIKMCPLVWKYDEVLDDVYTHDPDEVPCGFVPETAEIKTKKLDDGRTMLSTMAYVWKRYTGPLLSFFKRDGSKKPVSVEMSVFKTQPKEDGKTELLDFRYEGITVLGSYVTPAIPLAQASVLSFAAEYEEDFEKEFSNENIIIPMKMRYNAEKGLELRKELGGGTSTGIAFARYLTKNKTITPDKVREINNYYSTHENSKDVDWLLWGGDYAKEWVEKVSKRINEIVTFPYKSKTDMNPALKGISPPISLAQANAIARQADSIGSDDKKNGWAIAISSFKKTHHVQNGKWVKNKGSTAQAAAGEDISDLKNWEYWEEIVEEDFAAKDMGKGEAIQVNKSKDAMSSTAWGSVDKTSLMHKVLNASNYKSLVHDVYLVVDSGWEEHPSSSLHYPVMQIVDGKAVYNKGGLASALGRAKGQGESGVVNKVNGLYEKMGLNSEKKEMAMKFNLEQMSKFFADDDADEDVKMAKLECAKGDEADFGIIANGLFARMCKMEELMSTYAKENEELKKKAEMAAKPEEEETPEDEKAETAEEEKKEEEEGTEKKFAFPVKEMAEKFADDEDIKCALEEMAKEECDFGVVVQSMYAKMCKMEEYAKKLLEDNKTYMAENEQLKKFKADSEAEQKKFAVDMTLKELTDAVNIPEEVQAEMRAESEKYSLANIETWKNYCKAKSFDFAVKPVKKPEIISIGLPFGETIETKDDLWVEK